MNATIALVVAIALAHGPTPAPPKNVVKTTVADVVLYVDPLGSNSNTCTAPFTDGGTNGPCLTPQGALNKAPKVFRHRLTVNLAPGTYGGFSLAGLTVDNSVQQATSGVLIDGALVNSTLATSTATGTLSSATAGANTVFGTATDSTKAWTTDDLKGRLLVLTGGTGSGQAHRIQSNTATVITVVGIFSPVPDGTTTYAVQDESVFVNTTVAAVPTPQGTGTTQVSAAGIQVYNNALNGGQVTIRNINISAPTSCAVVLGTAVQFIQTTCSNFLVGRLAAQVTLQASRQKATCIFSGASVLSTGTGVAGSLFDGTLGNFSCSGAATQCTGGFSRLTGTSANFSGMNCVTGSVCGLSNSQVDCASASNSVAVRIGGGGAPPTSTVVSSTQFTSAGFQVNNCSYGMQAFGPGTVASFSNTSNSVLTGSVTIYGVLAGNGAAVALSAAGGTNTLTAGTSEVTLDNGLVNTTFSTFGSANNCISSLATGSRVCKL